MQWDKIHPLPPPSVNNCYLSLLPSDDANSALENRYERHRCDAFNWNREVEEWQLVPQRFNSLSVRLLKVQLQQGRSVRVYYVQ